ncbi:MAG: hypothetical protein ACI97N_002325 [Cognaticolwellia sp.]|jgi:hypothetical protein
MNIKFTLIPFFLLLMTFSTTVLHSQNIRINEIMSSNNDFLEDKDNEYNDWIELYNTENQAINLQGFSLSDDISALEKWTFPSVMIPAKGFLLVFASGKDIQDITELHTNFKIKQSGEAIFLSYSNQIISTIPSIQIPTNKSYGSIQDGDNNYTIFQSPTPKTTNETGQSIYASHISGFYKEDFLLTLIPSNSNQEIHYTLNGKAPSAIDKYYSAPILIKNNSSQSNSISNIPTTPGDYGYHWIQPETVYKTNVIRYALFENDTIISSIYSKTYFVDSTIYDRYKFPIISLIIDSLNLFDYEKGIYIPGKRFDDLGYGAHPYGNYNIQGQQGERPVHISYFEPNGFLAFETDAGLRMRGVGSASYPQKSFNVYFKEDYGTKEIEYPIFENTAINKRIVLRNSGQDVVKTHFKDALLQSILEPLGMELQDLQPAIIFINGEYWGIYNLREKYDRFYFKNRYDIAEDNINILDYCGYAETGNHDDYRSILNYINTNDLKNDIHYEYVKNKIDIDNYINFQIAEIFYAHYDWPCNNYKIWKTNDADSKWRFLIYDLDLSFAHAHYAHYDSLGIKHATHLASNWPHCECSNILFVKLLENEQFKTLFISKFEEYLNTIFEAKNIINKINEFKQLYIPEMKEHIERWSYPNSLTVWDEEIKIMKEFAIKRPCFVRKDLMEYFDLEEFDFQCSSDNEFNEEHQIIIFPNPNDGNVYLKNKNSGESLIGDIQILDINGRTVSFHKEITLFADESTNINLTDLNNGVYFLIYQNAELYIIEKLVIAR